MPAYILDQSYITGQDNSDAVGNLRIAANNNTIIGQGFTPTITAPFTKFSFLLKKIGSPIGNIWVTLASNTADPSGSLIGSQSINIDASTISGTYGYVEFTFPTPSLITKNTVYWALLNGDYATSSTDAIIVGIDTSSPSYAGGNAGRYGNGGAAWEALVTYDCLFKEYHGAVGGLLTGEV